MNIPDLWAEIEREHAWRIDELRFFQNQLINFDSDSEKKTYRKALVLLLYSHFEGFCKFALVHYVKAVNSEGLRCIDVNYALAAATLSELFAQLRNPDSKSSIFKSALPTDAKLHRFARDKEFLEKMAHFGTRSVTIPDKVIDTESNLKPVVLRKNLFQIGLPHDKFAGLEGQINKLLEFRNNIAHGSKIDGLEEAEYEKLSEDVNLIIRQIKRDIMSSLSSAAYLRV
jgi:hypothetical protein